MSLATIFVFLLVLIAMGGGLALRNLGAAKESDLEGERAKDMKATSLVASRWLTWIGIVLGVGYGIYYVIEGTPMEGHVLEWMNLLVRWMHIIFGIAWVGASFYFVFLENSLNRTEGLRDELAGNLWAVHGGGFYYLEKYKVAPQKIPKHLHWFKYEAYMTWVSGTALLMIVYYFNAQAFLIDPTKLDISPITGVMIGIGAIIGSWFVYELLSKTPLLKRRQLFFWIMAVYLTVVAYILCQIFNPRAAYIHVGAIMGTMMAGNVFFVIIPAQKAMVFAAKEDKPLDSRKGKYAGLRSYHNNYFTLPVLFIMISNHFPATFGHEHNWAVLAAISLAGAGLKHIHNWSEKGGVMKWDKYVTLPVCLFLLVGVVWYTAPVSREDALRNAEPVGFEEIQVIMQERCNTCHSANPTDDVNVSAPNGVMFDKPEDIVKMKDKIMLRAIQTKTMPQGNKTKMTDEEREKLEIWILQGADVNAVAHEH